MPAERYFLESALQAPAHLELKGSEFHHLARVMRARQGDYIEVVNGKGTLAQACIQELSKEKALLKIEQISQEPEPSCRLILAQAICKPNRLEFILEKGTELGVNQFWLFPGDYSSQKEYYPHQLERAKSITIAAMKQCGRLYLPSINLQPSLEHWKNLADMMIFFGDLHPEAPPFESAWEKRNSSLYPIMFVTGPEGGLSKQEIQALMGQGAVGVKLHPHILRTETASLMALSLLSHWLFC